ncbi:MAG: protein-disulfide reductase DsbD [Thiotrichales bacterium]
MIKNLFSIFLLLIAQGAALAVSPDELLPADEAFKFLGVDTQDDRAVARFEIAKGYYLYKDKIKFEAPEGFVLGKPDFPEGKIKKDDLFGEVEIYRGDLSIPFSLSGSGTADITVKYQGCADAGVCYPPEKTQVKVASTATESKSDANSGAAAASSGALGELSRLSDSLTGGGSDQDELLSPDQAFSFGAITEPPNRIVADWMIADGYYLYKDKIKARLLDAEGATIKVNEYPETITHKDPQFGDVEIFRGPISIRFEVTGLKTKPDSLQAEFEFQGCADLGVCYPPIKKVVDLTAKDLGMFDASALADAKPEDQSSAPAPDAERLQVSEQDAIAQKLASGNLAVTLLSFLGFGLLLALTPCVFPMIPILSGIIVGQGEKLSTTHSFMLSLVYVLAMAVVYAIVGVIAGLTGANLQALFQNPWVLISFAAVFVALAFSMFGFYELQMPNAIQSKLTEVSNRQQGGKLLSAAIMGVLSALIVGPCVTAPLMGALIFISQTGSAVVGGLALFAMGLGMGAPLLLIGLSAGKLLPKAGGWMDAVKAVFGVMLLGVAIWFLERVLPSSVTLLMWSLLLILSGVYMGALSSGHQHSDNKWFPAWRGIGIALLIYGVLMLVGVASGSGTPLQPLKGLSFGGSVTGERQQAQGLDFIGVADAADLEAKLAEAKAAGKPVMLDFTAEWCAICQEMEHYTFSDPAVRQALSQVTLLQADVTDNNAQHKALLKQFGLIGPPAILYWTAQGDEQTAYRLVGFTPANEFIAHSREAMKL